MAEIFTITTAEARDAVITTAEKVNAYGYSDIVEETMSLVRQRSRDFQRPVSAGIMESPAVFYVVDLTLTMLSQPSVAGRMPLEIWRRGSIAHAIATTMGALKGHVDVYQSMFRDYGGIPRYAQRVLSDTDRHANLAGNVFREATFGIGGAFRFLQEQGVDENRAGIIKSSITLPKKIGPCSGPRLVTMYEQLGDPYADSDALQLQTGNRGTTVTFSKAATLLLDKLRIIDPAYPSDKADGCPAMHMPSPTTDNQTMFIDSWGELTDFFVPPGATANEPEGSLGRYVVRRD